MWKNWFTIFNVKVTVRAYNHNMIIFAISSKQLVSLQPNVYGIMSRNVLWKNRITAFKVKGSYYQNMTFSTIFSELLIPWQPNLA